MTGSGKKNMKTRSTEMADKPSIKKPNSLSTSDSGSSINSQKNKSDLDHLKKSIIDETGKQGFVIKMNIDNKNLKKLVLI